MYAKSAILGRVRGASSGNVALLADKVCKHNLGFLPNDLATVKPLTVSCGVSQSVTFSIAPAINQLSSAWLMRTSSSMQDFAFF